MGITLIVGAQEITLSATAANVTLSTYIPGPQGEVGPPGPSGGAGFTLPTNSAIGGNRAVGTGSEYAIYADCSTGIIAVGISMAAVSSGEDVTLQSGSKMIVTGAGWTPGGIIYTSTNGTLTQAEPTTGFSQKLGIAHNAETILIDISRPINLA